MLYKTKLERNIEEFKSKDEVKFSEVQDLKYEGMRIKKIGGHQRN